MAVIYKQTVENLSERRIDAWHYQPNFQNQINKIKQNVGVIFLNDVIDKSRGVASGATPLGANYLQNGKVKFYRTSEVEGMFLDSQKAVYISEDDDEKLARSRLKAGDILLTITGAKFGKSAVVSELHLPGNISQHSVRFHPKPELIDSYFLVAYLESDIGQDIIWREAYGATRPAIDFPSVRALTLPKVNLIAQKYIGDKVRQAELLREWAKSLRAEVDNELNKFSFATDLIPSTVNKVSTQILEDRLDPRPYRNHYINLVDQIKKVTHSNIGNLATLNSGCPVSSSDFLEEKAVPLIRIRNIGYEDFIGVDTYISESLYEEEGRYQAEENMIVIGMDGIFRAQFILAEELPMLINQRVAILKPSEIRSELLTHWLNRPEGQMQLNQWAVKTTVEHTSLTDIGRVLIPRLTQEVEDYLADKLRNARKALKVSKALIESAKYIVENLIEGAITEDDLLQSQNALEQGDTSLDCAILSQMAEDGYAVAGSKPLFSDLDEFYDLLEQAKTLE